MPQPAQNKAEAIVQLETLVQAFTAQRAHYKSADYKESQLRNDFLNQLLRAFGWDVDNEAGKAQALRDVVQEEELEVEEADEIKIKNPEHRRGQGPGYRGTGVVSVWAQSEPE